MYIDGTESWSIVTSSDISLNFAIFTGCMNLYILIKNGGCIN